MSFRTSQRTCELRNEVRNICGQSFVKSTVKSSPGWGIFHSQLAQGSCISLQVVSRHPGIYTIITDQIKCPGVFPGGVGVVTPGIDSCITTENYCRLLRTLRHQYGTIVNHCIYKSWLSLSMLTVKNIYRRLIQHVNSLVLWSWNNIPNTVWQLCLFIVASSFLNHLCTFVIKSPGHSSYFSIS
jgi:hypothetical protein